MRPCARIQRMAARSSSRMRSCACFSVPAVWRTVRAHGTPPTAVTHVAAAQRRRKWSRPTRSRARRVVGLKYFTADVLVCLGACVAVWVQHSSLLLISLHAATNKKDQKKGAP